MLRAPVTYDFHPALEAVTTLHDFGSALGQHLDTPCGLSEFFMVTALGLCVKWPSGLHF